MFEDAPPAVQQPLCKTCVLCWTSNQSASWPEILTYQGIGWLYHPPMFRSFSHRALNCMLLHEGADEGTAGDAAETGAWDDDAGEAGAAGGELPDIVELRRDEAVRCLP